MNENYIFVYGTLKKEFPNYHVMDGKAKFISDGITKHKFNLVVGGKYNVPFLFFPNDELKGNQIYGEIYSVDDDMLFNLDKFEGCPNYYYRELVPINNLDEKSEMKCYIYIKKDTNGLLELPTLEFYDLDPNYVPPDKRPNGWKDCYLSNIN